MGVILRGVKELVNGTKISKTVFNSCEELVDDKEQVLKIIYFRVLEEMCYEFKSVPTIGREPHVFQD